MNARAFVNWFIPEELRSDVESYHRSFLVVGFAFAATLAKIMSNVGGAVSGASVGWADWLLVLIAFSSPFALKFAKSDAVAGNLFVGGLMFSFVHLLVAYGPTTNALRWIINVVPITGFLLLRFRYGISWVVVAGVTITGMLVLKSINFWDEELMSKSNIFNFQANLIIDIYINFIAVALIGILMERGKEAAFASLDKALAESKTLADDLKAVFAEVEENSEKIANSADDFSNLGSAIEENANETTAQASEATTGSEHIASKNKELTETLTNLSKSIDNIGDRSANAVNVAQTAVQRAKQTDELMANLGKSSGEIAKVSEVIFTIARQTNLLSLNAAIEAAKAGEAGKGFAVVAGQVKSLAVKTTTATSDIANRIETIQSDSRLSIDAIGEINKIIQQINDLQTEISGTVDSQKNLSSDMNRIASEVALRRRRLNSNVKNLAETAKITSSAITDILDASRALAELGGDLKALLPKRA